ncbi:MAG: glycosyltransferase family 39 protein [Bdellovibrionales bacterium]|nr:glycosyltransferase family 39 protein [Bdellovibrionales bacterium]
MPRPALSSAKTWSKSLTLTPIFLMLILIARGVTLEHGDLVDPTETRYATIAQNMFLTGDWLTPRLPNDNQLEPFLGKPPLHFWLTALSYRLFGVDEWTSRLPSFVGLMLIAGALIVFSNNVLNKKIGYTSAIICATSPLMFFLAGSSTIDVTFTAFITAALVSFAYSAKKHETGGNSIPSGLAFFFFCALAFLTKGPAAFVIVGLPIFALCLLDRSLSGLSHLPWKSGLALCALFVVPWFYLLEQSNPGAIKYFFVNENFLRFLVKDYGDRYGHGHVRMYGSIWWMIVLGIFPWSFFLLRYLGYEWRKIRKLKLTEFDRWVVFALAWGLSPLVFFTFARSVLPAYALPAIPGLAIAMGYLIHSSSLSKSTTEASSRYLGKLLSFNYYPSPERVAFGATALMMCVVLFITPLIESDLSASEVLEAIADNASESEPIVGTLSRRSYSLYWTSGAYENELSKPLQIVFASQNDLSKAKYKHLVVRSDKIDKFPKGSFRHYEQLASRGKWQWYSRIADGPGRSPARANSGD